MTISTMNKVEQMARTGKNVVRICGKLRVGPF